MLEYILLFIVALFAAVVSSTVGIGAALILVPITSLIIPIKQAIAVTNIYFITLAISKVITFRKNIDWAACRDILYGAIPLALIGSYALVAAESSIIKKILGAVILITVTLSFLPSIKRIKITRPLCIGGGALYGFFSAMIGDGSAIKAMLLTQMNITKERFVATIALTALVINTIKAIAYTTNDIMTIEQVPLAMVLGIIAIIGARIGKNMLSKMDTSAFVNIMKAMLVIMALKLLLF